MSKFPTQIDDDTDLPPVNDNLTDIGAEAINATRDAIFNIEGNIGIGAAGTMGSVAERLSVSIQPDGYIKSSILTTLGLVTLPITNNQIAENAQIPESKLRLNFRTQDLYNYTKSLVQNVNSISSWIALTGIKLEPHITGFLYRHEMDKIDVSSDGADYLKNKFGILRNNSQSYALVNDINNELLAHQFADGSAATGNLPIITNNGSIYGSDYAHTASGIFLNPNRFSSIPQTIEDLQKFAEFIDSSSIFVYGTRIQNLYSNGISKASRSAKLDADGYGQPIVPPTTAITYLLNIGTSSSPVDSITNGDDIIEFTPPQADINSNSFDAKFALVKVGDIARVNYGNVEVKFVIKEKKYYQNAGVKKYVIRVVGKNLYYTTNAQVRIDKPLFNTNKDGVLAVAAANGASNSITPSLIVGSPRGAQALGLGFNPDQFDSTHYLLYLALYPNGVPEDGYRILPGIDVTGNKGATPGRYTLDSITEATNNAFRAVGYNYRFIAFQHNGEFGIMLADSYNNASFSVFSAVVDANGFYDSLGTSINFPNNVVGVFANSNASAPDPLGFGSNGAGIASPPFMISYGSAEAAVNPTKLFTPLKRNNYYVNGTEREKLILEVGQILDTYGDGYWVGRIIAPQNIYPGPFPAGRVETTYRIAQNLQTSGLKIGKTIVIQSVGQGTISDFGRFIIQNISFGCGTAPFTDITVYDAVHGTSISPSSVLGVDGYVGIYFNSDSVSFNTESATDTVQVAPFKRHFEVYIDEIGNTFTHERSRINASNSLITINGSVPLYTFSELNKLNIVKVSPKLRGYQFGSVNKISLFINNFDTNSGVYDGYFCSYDGITFTNKGPNIIGKKGQTTRFYDETNSDYIDIIFDVNTGVSSFNNEIIDFQLFPTLSLDDEVMMVATCQLNDVTNNVTQLRDERQFGNVSEKEFSTSALSFMSLPERLLHANGVIRGFDLEDKGNNPNPNAGQIYMTGGLALVNGKFVQVNDQTVVIPLVKELLGTLFNINWALCVNDRGEYQPIPLRDFDATLGTPNDDSRIFKVFNPLNGQVYNLDSVLFSDLVNNRKDLTILYIVASTVVLGSGLNPSTISLSKTDARKYVNDVDTNLPLRLTVGSAQGNFKNPESIFNWIKYNNTFNSKAIVKGADLDTGVINTSLILDFNSTAIIDGENQATLTMNGPVILGSNLTLQNLNITFNGTLSLSASVQNLLLDNCNIVINMPDNLPALAIPADGYTIFDFINSDNIVIKDCNFTILYNGNISSGTVFRLNNTTNFIYNNNSFTIDFQPVSAPVNITPGDIFRLTNSPGAIITNSDFTGNFNKFIHNTGSNSLNLMNLVVTSTYNPNAGASPDTISGVTYSTGSLVNSGQGYIYSNVSTKLDDIKIDNVVFNYSPGTTSAGNDRYSFINFELSTNTSILSNLSINSCRFNNTNVNGSSTDDIRAAIAIINTSAASLSTQQQPLLINASITNNICNRNQMILLTSKTVSPNGAMVYPGLAAQNCSVSDNICGTIGYWISSGAKVVNTPPNVNSFSDKASGLLISNNTCHFITNLDEMGALYRATKIVSGTSVNLCPYPSGYVTIRNNKCNWIHVSITYEEDAALHVIDNSLHAYAQSYLNQYGTTTTGNLFAIFVDSNIFSSNTSISPGIGSDAACIISGNVTGAGYWLQTTLTTLTYKYSSGYILAKCSAQITNNVLKGVNNDGNAAHLIFVSGLHSIITNNRIYRKDAAISSYIGFTDLNAPSWNGNTSTGIITDNFFDSPFIDSLNNESVIYLPSTVINRWVFEKNKNQTGYAVIPLTNHSLFSLGVWGPNAGSDSLSALTGISPMNDGSSNTGAYKSQYAFLHDNATPETQRNWGAVDNLEKYLPNGVRVIQLRMGLRPFGTSVSYNSLTQSPSNFFINIFRINSAATYYDTSQFASFSSVDSYIPENGNPVFSIVTGGQINATYGNIGMLINLENYVNPQNGTSYGDISYNYITGRGQGISLSFDWRWLRINETTITLSPVQVKYRW